MTFSKPSSGKELYAVLYLLICSALLPGLRRVTQQKPPPATLLNRRRPNQTSILQYFLSSHSGKVSRSDGWMASAFEDTQGEKLKSQPPQL